MDKRIAIGGLARRARRHAPRPRRPPPWARDDPSGCAARRRHRPRRRPPPRSTCDGGQLRSMKSRIGNSPFTFAETGGQRPGPGGARHGSGHDGVLPGGPTPSW